MLIVGGYSEYWLYVETKNEIEQLKSLSHEARETGSSVALVAI